MHDPGQFKTGWLKPPAMHILVILFGHETVSATLGNQISRWTSLQMDFYSWKTIHTLKKFHCHRQLFFVIPWYTVLKGISWNRGTPVIIPLSIFVWFSQQKPSILGVPLRGRGSPGHLWHKTTSEPKWLSSSSFSGWTEKSIPSSWATAYKWPLHFWWFFVVLYWFLQLVNHVVDKKPLTKWDEPRRRMGIVWSTCLYGMHGMLLLTSLWIGNMFLFTCCDIGRN